LSSDQIETARAEAAAWLTRHHLHILPAPPVPPAKSLPWQIYLVAVAGIVLVYLMANIILRPKPPLNS
jgi:hypothetical protein